MSFNNPIEEQRFQDIQEMEGLGILNFQQEQPEDLFPNATYHPEFFNQNLVNPNRVLKQLLNDPQSNIRVFYYQLIRLAFEVPTEHGYNHNCMNNFKKIVFHPEFEILFTPDTESEREVFNDFQFKKLFAEFVSLLVSASESGPPNVEQVINQFPIIDIVIIHIIRSLLVSFNIKAAFDQKIPTDLLFKELSSVLQLSLTSYGNCWKFQESDMFCYEENDNELYLAYILDDEEDDNDDSQQEEFGYNGQPIPNNDLGEAESRPVVVTSSQYQDPRNTLDQYKPSELYIPNVTYSGIQSQGDSYEQRSYPAQATNGGDKSIEDMFNRIDNTIVSINNDSRSYQTELLAPVHNKSQMSQPSKYEPPVPPYDFVKFQLSTNYTTPSINTYNNSLQLMTLEQVYPPGYIPIKDYVASRQGREYNLDFTPPEVLSKLRPHNRQNIIRIRESFGHLQRGSEIPPGFDVSGSAVRVSSHVDGGNFGKKEFSGYENSYARPTHSGWQQNPGNDNRPAPYGSRPYFP